MRSVTLLMYLALGWLAAPPAIALPNMAHTDTLNVRPLARRANKPGKLQRFVNRVRRMPTHTKAILCLCAAGIVLFFVAVWVKSQM